MIGFAWRAQTASTAISISAIMPPFLVGAMSVEIAEELHLNPATLGLAVSSAFLSTTCVSFFAGRKVDAMGWQRGIRIACGINLFTLLSLVFVPTWWLLVAVLVVGGVANAMSSPAANLAVSRVTPLGRQALMFGIKQSAAPAATGLAGLAVPVIALAGGWRWAFAVAAIVPLMTWLTVPGKTREVHQPPPTRSVRVRPPLRPLNFLALTVAGGVGVAGGMATAAFYVAGSQSVGVDPAQAGLGLALASAVGISSRVALGWATDVWSWDPVRTMAILMAITASGTALLALGVVGWWRIAAGVLILGIGWSWTGQLLYAAVRARSEAAASATGIVQSGLSGGAASGPLLFGLLVSITTYAWSWTALAIVTFLAAVVVGRWGRRSEP